MSKRGGIRSRHRKALESERDRVSPEQLREVMRVLGEKACFIIGGHDSGAVPCEELSVPGAPEPMIRHVIPVWKPAQGYHVEDEIILGHWRSEEVRPCSVRPPTPTESGGDDSRTGLPSDSATSQNGPTSGASRSNVDRNEEGEST